MCELEISDVTCYNLDSFAPIQTETAKPYTYPERGMYCIGAGYQTAEGFQLQQLYPREGGTSERQTNPVLPEDLNPRLQVACQ